MNLKKRVIGILTASALSLGMIVSAIPETLTASAGGEQYAVQEFRFGIGDTNRSVTISEQAEGAYLTSVKEGEGGTRDEKWSLNYISSGVYEIVNSATGYILTNESGLPVLAPDTDAQNQRWRITGTEKDHEGYYLYYKITADDGTVLTFHTESNSLASEEDTGDSYQKFKLNLDGLEGFAGNCMVSQGEKAGTTGGLLGETVFVSNDTELINALGSKDPMTIVLTKTIDMHPYGQIRVRDNKTITGCYGVTLKDCQLRTNNQAGNDSSDKPSDNLVIRNLNLLAKDSLNCILVNVYSSRNVWIDHCTFTSELNRNRDEVGKFVWVNTPYDGVDLSRSPDYITISYNVFSNRYWTFAYGTQNNETTRCRTTLMYNHWDNCVRRCPQIGNGTGHIYSSYFNGYNTNSESGTAQIIGGDGSEIVSENCRFENISQVDTRCISAGGGSEPYRDSGSYLNYDKITFNPKVTSTWKPQNANYGYTLIRGYDNNYTDTGTFCKNYTGAFKSYDGIKYIGDADMSKFVDVRYPSPFLKDIQVGSEPVGRGGAQIDTSHKYVFKNVGSGLYLETDGNNVQQGNSETGWNLEEHDGWYSIISEDGNYLTVQDGSADNGANIAVSSQSAGDGQLFRFVKNADASYTVVTKPTNGKSAVGIYAGSVEAGANAMQWVRDGSDNQKWNLEISVPALNGKLIQNLTVKDLTTYQNWSIDEDAEINDLIYGDRDAFYTEIPDALIGAEMIVPACDAKNTDTTLAGFTAGADMTAYAAFDQRVSGVPAWLTDWTKTDLTAKSNKEVTYLLWKKEVKAGETVTLGTNGQSSGCVNYTVFAVPSGSASVKGDADNNGSVNVTDAVMLQKWLLKKGSLTSWQNADMNDDGIINIFDLILMKRALLK